MTYLHILLNKINMYHGRIDQSTGDNNNTNN
ncbi:unnamed protein product [Trichobilharzia regenti]|nr:unnamed protein product [Trichobilharzia regenti]